MKTWQLTSNSPLYWYCVYHAEQWASSRGSLSSGAAQGVSEMLKDSRLLLLGVDPPSLPGGKRINTNWNQLELVGGSVGTLAQRGSGCTAGDSLRSGVVCALRPTKTAPLGAVLVLRPWSACQ